MKTAVAHIQSLCVTLSLTQTHTHTHTPSETGLSRDNNKPVQCNRTQGRPKRTFPRLPTVSHIASFPSIQNPAINRERIYLRVSIIEIGCYFVLKLDLIPSLHLSGRTHLQHMMPCFELNNASPYNGERFRSSCCAVFHIEACSVPSVTYLQS